MQKPSLGRVVLTRVDPAENNGATEAPAIVTRVWGEHPAGGWTINVRVLLDGTSAAPALTSVRLADTEPEGDARHVAWWPPRA